MSMFVNRKKPCSVFDLRRMESWMEDLAGREGLFVEEWTSPFVVKFKRDNPKWMQYRLLFMFRSYGQDFVQEAREAGWEAVKGSCGWRVPLYLFRAEVGTPPLPADMTVQESGFRCRKESAWIWTALTMVLLIGILFGMGSRIGLRPVHILVENSPYLVLILAVFLGMVVRNLALGKVCKRSLRRMEEEPSTLLGGGYGVNWRYAERMRPVPYILWFLLLFLAGCFNLVGPLLSWKDIREDGWVDVPYVTLAEIREEETPWYLFDKGFSHPNFSTPLLGGSVYGFASTELNAVVYRWSLLGNYYTENQEKITKTVMPGNPTSIQHDGNNLQVLVAELATESLATAYLDEELDHLKAYMPGDWEELETDLAVDQVLHYQREGYKYRGVALRVGNKIALYVCNNGENDLTEHLEVMAERLVR